MNHSNGEQRMKEKRERNQKPVQSFVILQENTEINNMGGILEKNLKNFINSFKQILIKPR